MRSKILQEILDEMDKDPWYKKLRRKWSFMKYDLICRSRKYWDRSFSGFIFKKQK